jgi:hypothetical protein
MSNARNIRPRKNGPLSPDELQIMKEVCDPYRGMPRKTAVITAILTQFQARTGRTVGRPRVARFADLKPYLSDALYVSRRAGAEADLAKALAAPRPPLNLARPCAQKSLPALATAPPSTAARSVNRSVEFVRRIRFESFRN